MSKVFDRAAGPGAIVGTYADNAEMARRWIDAGVQYVAVSVDGALLTRTFAEVGNAVRE